MVDVGDSVSYVFRVRSRRIAVVAAALASVAAVVAVIPAAASASCGLDCHGVTRWYPATRNSAEIAVVNTSALGIDDICGMDGYSTTWEGTNNDQYFNTWVEEGLHIGIHYNGTCGATGVQFYWAHKRPDGTYVEIYPTGATPVLGTSYTFKIRYTGNDEWGVYRDGNVIDHALNDPCCSYGSQAGAEARNGDSLLAETGQASGLQKEVNGSWSYGWELASVFNPEHYFSMSGDPTINEYYSH